MNQIVLSDNRINHKFLSKKLKKRLKWFLSRLAIFAVNYGQMVLVSKFIHYLNQSFLFILLSY